VFTVRHYSCQVTSICDQCFLSLFCADTQDIDAGKKSVVCLSVCLSRAYVLQKRLNGSRFCLGWRLLGPKEHCIGWIGGPDSLTARGGKWKTVLPAVLWEKRGIRCGYRQIIVATCSCPLLSCSGVFFSYVTRPQIRYIAVVLCSQTMRAIPSSYATASPLHWRLYCFSSWPTGSTFRYANRRSN